jgi:hypothetical protein
MAIARDRHSVINSAASYGEEDLVEAMLAHLTEEDRGEVWRHTDAQVSDEISHPLHQRPLKIRLRLPYSSDEENE